MPDRASNRARLGLAEGAGRLRDPSTAVAARLGGRKVAVQARPPGTSRRPPAANRCSLTGISGGRNLKPGGVMRAAVFRGPRSIEVADRPDPSIQETMDAVVRVVLACVCGSDLWFYRGETDFAP